MRPASLLAALFLAAAPCSPASAQESAPNFVIFLADDLGAQELGCYGNGEHATPNLDRLAAGGMRFRTCYATPLCSPTRVEMLTGRYGFRTGWYNFRGRPGSPTYRHPEYVLSDVETTFADLLGAAGYATALAGKWQLGGKPPELVRDCGFQEYRIWAYTHNLPAGVHHSGGWQGAKGKVTSRYWNPCLVQNGSYLPTSADQYGPDLFADFVLDFARRHREKPFLIYYPMCLTHAPWVAPPDPAAPGGKGRRGLKSNVEYLDRIVGRVLAGLEELGLRERTVVLFAGDNGTQGAGKAETSERGVRVPLIASWPGIIPAGAVSDELVDFSDVLPTLVELAGAKIPSGLAIDGVSLAPTLRDPTAPHREWIFSYLHSERILRDRRWLLEGDGRLFDCGASRDGSGYREVSASKDPQVLAARRRFEEILRALPAPQGLDPCPVIERHKRAARARREAAARAEDLLPIENPRFEPGSDPGRRLPGWRFEALRTRGRSHAAQIDPEGSAALVLPERGKGVLLESKADTARGDLVSAPFALEPYRRVEVTLEYRVEQGAPLLLLCLRPSADRFLVDLAFAPTARSRRKRRATLKLHSSSARGPYSLAVAIGGRGAARIFSIAAREAGPYSRPTRPICVLDIRTARPGAQPNQNIARLAAVFGFPAVEYLHFTRFSPEKLAAIDPALLILPGLISLKGADRKALNAAVRAAIEYPAPVVGLCLGHQILARLFGAKLERRAEWGAVRIDIVKKDPLFAGLPRTPFFYASESHNFAIDAAPSNMRLLASSKTCKTQIFRYPKKRWVTFQCHIERGWEVATPEACLLWKNLLRGWKLIH